MSVHSKSVTTKKGSKMTSYYIRGAMIWLSYYVEGKRFLKSSGLKNTPTNLKVVTTKLIPALDIKIATGEMYKKKSKTFEYYGDIYLGQKDSNRSFLAKLNIFMSVIDYFRGRDIDSISRLDVKQYLGTLKMKSISKYTYKSCTKEIFELACDDGVLDYNPALGIKLKPDVKEDIQYYERVDIDKLLEASTGVMRAYLHVAFNTGMRVGEILGLQLGDFKDDGYLHIKRTRTEGIVGNGKTNNAIRKIPYPKYILDEVKMIQGDNIFIFGSYDDSAKLKRRWAKVVKDSGVVHHKMSCTRHTFATLMLKENIVSINELAGLLGHSKAKTTLEHYASVIDGKDINLGDDFSLVRYNTATVTKNNRGKALN